MPQKELNCSRECLQECHPGGAAGTEKHRQETSGAKHHDLDHNRSKTSQSLTSLTWLSPVPWMEMQNQTTNSAPLTRAPRAITSFSTTHFSHDEVTRLSKMFRQNFKAEYSVNLKTFFMDSRLFKSFIHSTFGITSDVVLEGIFRTFDVLDNKIVSEGEWIHSLSSFIRGKFDEKLEFIWKVYDVDGNGILSRDEMFLFLHDSIVSTKADDANDVEEAAKDLIEVLQRKLDFNHDQVVDKEDYKNAVHDCPLLMQCLGEVIPPSNFVQVFEATFAKKFNIRME